VKDFEQDFLEESRPSQDTSDAVRFCLRQLFRDRKHRTFSMVTNSLSFEELIGALLLARDDIARIHVLTAFHHCEKCRKKVNSSTDLRQQPHTEMLLCTTCRGGKKYGLRKKRT